METCLISYIECIYEFMNATWELSTQWLELHVTIVEILFQFKMTNSMVKVKWLEFHVMVVET